MQDNQERLTISQKLRHFRNGATFGGLGGMFGFFNGIELPLAPSAGGAAFPLLKNAINRNLDGMFYNSVGWITTNFLTQVLLNENPDFNLAAAFLFSSMLCSLGSEALAYLCDVDDRSRNTPSL